MCGIFGLVQSHGVDLRALARMGQLIRHRGPDGDGFVLFGTPKPGGLALGGDDTPPQAYTIDTPSRPQGPLLQATSQGWQVGLGHRRLAIVDLSALGHQPMASEDGRHWIVFNGEIYNHPELRTELQALGHQFRSHSDTEVILTAYRQWGVDCLHRFNGMWAFVLYDLQAGHFFMARDRFGVKPLHWWRGNGQFAFSSEVKSLLALPQFQARADADYLRRYLVDGPEEWADHTAFHGVHRLPPASHVLATPQQLIDGDFRPVTWWKLQPVNTPRAFNDREAADHAQEYLELLRSAVELRLRADVAVGSALSGGLDSTSVVYLVAQQIERQREQRQQETFTSVYSRPGTEHCDESGYVQEVGARLKVHLNTIEPQAHDVPTEHSRMIWHMDMPPESTCMSAWHTFKLVNSRGIKVTLDGQGADEQLGGYLTYLPIALAERRLAALASLPRLLKVQPPRVALGGLALALASACASLPRLAPWVRGRRATVLRQIGHGLNTALASDSFSGLTNLIHYADRTSMAFSVESRMPFLDYRLAEFLTRLPAAYKIHDGWTKYVARRAFDGKLPDSVVWRKDKMGWPIPEETWERGELSHWFARTRDAQARMEALGVGAEFRAACEHLSVTWRVRALNLAHWHSTFIEGQWQQFVPG